MITNLINTIWNEVINFIASIFPDSTGLPSAVSTAINFLLDKLYGFSLIVPADDIILIIQYTIVFEAMVLIWHFVRWVINLVRGSGA